MRDYIQNADEIGDVSVAIAADSTMPDGIQLDNGKISGKLAKANEDGREVTFTFTAKNGTSADLTLLFKIAKADPKAEVFVADGTTYFENDPIDKIELIISEDSNQGIVAIVSNIKKLMAGKNVITWEFIPEDNENYNTVTGTVIVNAQTTTTTTTTFTTTSETTSTTNATTTSTNQTTTFKALYGDVNMNGQITIIDVVLLNKAIAGKIVLSEQAFLNADCGNVDQVLDEHDLNALMQYLVGYVTQLPVEMT